MYFNINLYHGFLYTINPKYFNYLLDEDELDLLIPDDHEGVSFVEWIKTIKEKLYMFFIKNKVIHGMMNACAMIPSIPDVLSLSILKIIQ